MSDPLYDLLAPRLPKQDSADGILRSKNTDVSSKYLSRLLSLRLSDLTTTEPQSLVHSNHSNNVSLQALSSRSHKTTTASAAHLSVLSSSLPALTQSITSVREAIPTLDESAVTFASTYARSRDVSSTTTATSTGAQTGSGENPLLQARKDSTLLSRQANKVTDILELPTLLSTAIASAGSGVAGSANYSQALDLFAHIKRLSIVYPDSTLVRNVQIEAEAAMKSMTTNLLAGLRAQNIRLAAAIRTVGWLRRVVPELTDQPTTTGEKASAVVSATAIPGLVGPSTETTQSEGSYGALFLVSRLHTFLSMTEALAPLRDLADQETERRLATTTTTTTTNTHNNTQIQPPTRRLSSSTVNNNNNNTASLTSIPSSSSSSSHGTQTERYLKRYIEIFREQSFSTISMYRNIFPSTSSSEVTPNADPLSLPSALQQFPLHLVEIFMDVLRTYLPNMGDASARESLLMQVLYSANSLGRLGADFSMMIALLDEETRPVIEEAAGQKEGNMAVDQEEGTAAEVDGNEAQQDARHVEPEWARIIKKHRVQAARLDALAAGQNQASRRESDIAVR